MQTKPDHESLIRRLLRWLKSGFKWLAYAVLVYLAIVLVGLIPVNNDFVPTEDGIKLYLVSNAVHTDVIVPKSNQVIDWEEEFADWQFAGDISSQTHVAFGWGDQGFFLQTKTWDDFKVSTAANALLLPSESCMHVGFIRSEYISDAVSVTVSEQQYQRLVDHIESTFERDADGKRIQIAGEAYFQTDGFFRAKGRYHLLNTCNSWAGRALKAAGVKVPWLSPMPKSPMLYLDSG